MKMVEMKKSLVVATRVTRYHFVENSTDGIMVHAITRGFVLAPRQKYTKTMYLLISNLTGAITIVTTVIRITMPGCARQTVKYRQI